MRTSQKDHGTFRKYELANTPENKTKKINFYIKNTKSEKFVNLTHDNL
jgi:hypothetical protein